MTNRNGSKGVAVTQDTHAKNPGFFAKIYRLLFHEDVYYRIGGYLIFGLLLFFIAWASFQFLIKKPNLLADSFMVQKLVSSTTAKTFGTWGTEHFGKTLTLFKWQLDVAKEFDIWGNVLVLTFKYFVNHLIFVIPFIFLLNFFKVGRWNFGAIYFAFYTILWGAVIGTQSLSFPTGTNVALGSLILFARFGLWTWFSYLLLVVGTAQFGWLVAPNLSGWAWKQERKLWPVHFTPEQREVFIYGLLFLLASSFAEARIFVHYNL
ncbi:hypothetical protein EDC14_1003206 [Hydrogenispora ethanolica]|uniref:Uncharacterized protein n=1 Tax=Hydrogenispora ethanolica TaxID=1082276 RepID=A0A4R1S837_HYDET|nr:hypothetical protein [Hydrogenispora ethanolica]TCL75274.1 hypothetical protein EDC14_1003206 [Hydrogenispora ethanolica]